jgi:hypothetical protein
MAMIVALNGSTFAFSTYLFTKLQRGDTDTQRWGKRVNIFEKEKIFVPVNHRLHWTLVVVDMTATKISYYDSMRGQMGNRIDFFPIMLKYLREEWTRKMPDLAFPAFAEDRVKVRKSNWCEMYLIYWNRTVHNKIMGTIAVSLFARWLDVLASIFH